MSSQQQNSQESLKCNFGLRMQSDHGAGIRSNRSLCFATWVVAEYSDQSRCKEDSMLLILNTGIFDVLMLPELSWPASKAIPIVQHGALELLQRTGDKFQKRLAGSNYAQVPRKPSLAIVPGLMLCS